MQIRTGLKEGIPWDEIGFHEVYTAENGIEALELCDKIQPEIIITDIQMPGLNGLELGKEIKKRYQPAEVIILSGYSDFEYAREAIAIRAFDYLLKPIRINELIERVQNARSRIDLFYAEKKDKTELHTINRIRTIQQMIMSKEPLTVEEEKRFREQIKFKLSNLVVIGVCSVDKQLSKGQDDFDCYLETCMHEMLNKYKAEELYCEKGNLFFIMDVFSENDRKRKVHILKKEIQELNKIFEQQYGNTISLALSGAGDVRHVTSLLKEAESSLKKRMYSGAACVWEWQETDEQPKITLNPINISELTKRIESFDYPHVCVYLQEVFQVLKENKITSVDFVKSICEQLKNILFQTVLNSGINLGGIFENNETLLNEIPEYFTLSEYEIWIKDFYESVLKGLSKLSGKQHSRVILQAVDYISQNYAQNINLEMAAEYVNKSKNYFSYLFKKELGISFVEYLNVVRIEAAKQLLDTTAEKTYEISEKVGYSDYKYFSSVFKKTTGMSPAQYKKRNKS